MENISDKLIEEENCLKHAITDAQKSEMSAFNISKTRRNNRSIKNYGKDVIRNYCKRIQIEKPIGSCHIWKLHGDLKTI